MKRSRIWIIGIVLAAAVGFVALQKITVPVADNVISTPFITNTSIIIFTDTPIATPAYEGCGYMWAYRDAPELTEKINTIIRNINSEASARAELFGEDCVYADGSATFSAMETDFYVQLPVDDLADEADFGDWMSQVFSLIVQIPEEEIDGNYGFVEFSFFESEIERIIVRAPIGTYIAEAKEKSGAELFRFFYIPSVNPT